MKVTFSCDMDVLIKLPDEARDRRLATLVKIIKSVSIEH